jgi:hypothetical protein
VTERRKAGDARRADEEALTRREIKPGFRVEAIKISTRPRIAYAYLLALGFAAKFAAPTASRNLSFAY